MKLLRSITASLSIFLGTISIQPSNAIAASWERIHSSENTIVSIDPSSITQTGEYKTAWFLHEYSTDRLTRTGLRYRSAIFLNYFDCSTRTVAVKQYTFFSKPSKEGEPVQSYSYSIRPESFTEISPDSNAEASLKNVCSTELR